VELRPEDLAAYVRRVAPDRPDALDRIRASVARGERDLANTRVARDAAGGIAAALHVFPFGPVATLLVPFPGEDEALSGLVPEALRRARELGASLVRFRPREVGARLRAALEEHGFRELGERIEFKTPVEELPLDDGTPLLWRTVAEVGRDAAAETLARVAEGDPHGDNESDEPHEAIAEFLGHPRLTHGPECVQVGYLDGRPVAFVCAQVDPKDGWARVSYMGVAPEVRGRGLGAWVHRRGFRMLRGQGGRHYHGGTSTRNAPMLRLFRAHGCRETGRMHELEWRPAKGDG